MFRALCLEVHDLLSLLEGEQVLLPSGLGIAISRTMTGRKKFGANNTVEQAMKKLREHRDNEWEQMIAEIADQIDQKWFGMQ